MRGVWVPNGQFSFYLGFPITLRLSGTAKGRVQALTGSGISDSSSDAVRFLAAIPFSVFIISDAGTASSSRFNPAAKIVHDHAGIVFTFRWNPRSGSGGNRDHYEAQYATSLCARVFSPLL